MTLRAFLETIGQEVPLVMRTSVWQRSIDPAVLRFMRERGILQRGPIAEWYDECPRVGPACPARIIPTVRAKPTPFQAVPPDNHRCCLPVYLSEQEVATLQFDLAAFVALVRTQLGLRGAPKLDTSVISDGALYAIGQQRDRAVLYAPSFSNWAVVDRLRLMRERGPRAFVLTPTRSDFAMPDVEYEFGCGERLELGFLEDLLTWDDETHRIVVVQATITAESKDVHARALTDRGVLELDEAGYRALVQAREEYHFFLDMVSMVGSKHPALGLGDPREAHLTPFDASILAELVEAKRPREARSLAAFGGEVVSAAHKTVERVRRLVDVTRSARNDWAMFKTRKGLGGIRSYHFDPAADIRYAVLLPTRS
jgi:hypothetical protein